MPAAKVNEVPRDPELKENDKTAQVLLKRAHWFKEERFEPGNVVEVSIDKAMQLIEAGVAGRIDPL